MPLTALAAVVGGEVRGGDPAVRGITHDSRLVRPGDLYVAIPGINVDGTQFAADALARGAVAVCATRPVAGAPTLVTPDPRAALAPLAAAFFGNPARHLRLLGITGSLGKTSTTLLAEAALGGAHVRTGTIGSLGIRYRGRVVQTGMTTPEAPAIHGALRSMVAHDVDAAVMEVTSHSIRLHRVAGLEFDAGVLTNIVPDEHLEFHPTPEDYIRTKARFFDMLKPGAPLIVNRDDPVARERTRGLRRPVIDVSVSADASEGHGAHVRARITSVEATGSAFVLTIARPLPKIGGGEVAPCELSARLPILGRQQVANAVLALVLAAVEGAELGGAVSGIERLQPIRRRMEVIHDRGPVVLDDTVGNAQSIRGVFDTVRLMPRRTLRVAYAIRGSRGVTVNARNAAALAEEARATNALLVVTESDDAAGPRDRVRDDERAAVRRALDEAGASYTYEPSLRTAVRRVLEDAAPDDLVLLLGAQGMDRGAEFARESFFGVSSA